MPNIIHRLTIDAPPPHVHELIANREGVARWWTGHPVDGDDAVGQRISLRFRDGAAAAVMEVVQRDQDRVAWRCVDGPREWIGTRVSFGLTATGSGGTTLLFRHEDWVQESEFMAGCSSNWCAYITSLKSGAEGRGFAPYPAGELSRWDA